MTATKLPIAVGTKVTPSGVTAKGLAADLGNLYEAKDGKLYRVCKCGTAITASAAGLLVSTAYSAGVPTWAVSKTTTAADSACVGVIPSGITTLAVSDHFLVQVTGNASVQANTTAVTDGDKIAPSTDGQAAAFTTISTSLLNVIGEATNTAGATAAGQLITADLRRIL